MKPTEFKGQTNVIANLPGHEPLPIAIKETTSGWVTSCWKLSIWERLKLLLNGRLFITQKTFNYTINPLFPCTTWKQPYCRNCGSPYELHKKPANRCPYKKDHITTPNGFGTYEPKEPPGSYQTCEIGAMEHNYNSPKLKSK